MPADSDTDARELDAGLRRHGPTGSGDPDALLCRELAGSRVRTGSGEWLLDFSCGGLLPLGHTPDLPGPAEPLVGPGQETASRVELMRKLAEITPGGMNRRVQLSDSGRGALARALALACSRTGRTRVCYLGEIEGRQALPAEDAAAVVVHPFDERVVRVTEWAQEHGVLVVDDESGLAPGISGRMLAIELSGVRPDVYVLSRGLAAGWPIGAAITGSSTLRWERSSDGGAPASCGQALEFIRRLEAGLIERVRQASAALVAALQGLPGVRLCGAGLALMLDAGSPARAAALAAGCRRHGLLTGTPIGRMVGIEPPLSVTDQELGLGAEAIRAAAEERK